MIILRIHLFTNIKTEVSDNNLTNLRKRISGVTAFLFAILQLVVE